MTNLGDKEYQEIVKQTNTMLGMSDGPAKEKLQNELIAKIDEWFKRYRPEK
jgi:hypothetical protein